MSVSNLQAIWHGRKIVFSSRPKYVRAWHAGSAEEMHGFTGTDPTNRGTVKRASFIAF